MKMKKLQKKYKGVQNWLNNNINPELLSSDMNIGFDIDTGGMDSMINNDSNSLGVQLRKKKRKKQSVKSNSPRLDRIEYYKW